MVGRHGRHEASSDLDRTAMTGVASRHRHLRVIKFRRCPARHFGADTGGMATLAKIGSRHVTALFADRFDAVMAVRTAVDDPGVIEIRTQPSGGQMTIAAFEIRRDMILRFSGSIHTVVANNAETLDRQRDLGVIDHLRRIPAHHGVTCFAHVIGAWMRT